MANGISIYCDESSHLENDNSPVMGLGAVVCPTSRKDAVFKRIREIKIQHKLPKNFEVKWSKVSNSKIDFYIDLVDYFFDVEYLGFRSVIINKDGLDHESNESNHDEFYYKMYFLLLKQLLEPSNEHQIYLDKKDTNGRKKIEKLRDFLFNSRLEYKEGTVNRVQEVVSDQIELVQLCDFLLGAVCYVNRNLRSNQGKLAIIKRIQQRSGYSLIKTTYPSERKMNTLIWVSSQKPGSDD